MTVRLLDERFAQQVGSQIELPVVVLDGRSTLGQGARAGLRAQALSSAAPAAARLDDPAVYLAVLPLQSPSGELIGLVETELPATGIARSLRELVQTLLL